MAGLELIDVSKSYGDVPVLEHVSLSVLPREFIAFLGPSGSGKSTLLRIIAGLENADSGEVWLDGERIDTRPPGARGIAMVFQHYALYPHMTVRENIAFGLVNAGVTKDEIARRIAQAADILEIAEQLDKKPGQMSGGQRQRVAIGRAIVKQPRLFLLDEPLSNLDAALRGRTRVELAQLRNRVDAALIMVTHDQAEAMTLADRIVILDDCCIQQIGTPAQVYARPANAFVARFVGSPPMAMLPGVVAGEEAGQVRVRLAGGAVLATAVPAGGLVAGTEVEVGLRPEHVRLAAPGEEGLAAQVELVERLGDRTFLYARLVDGAEIVALEPGFGTLRPGEAAALVIDAAAAHIFTAGGAAHHPEPRG
ncbi:ABC transporter ATP-binding protein [Erythrobacter sp. CCH5-A1]|uniref:ABC transporter ATP-binding protein n=1 Tax=Erythrobacter sp. CCH5-A1 TaxID=1768792 RepID=UPI000829B326|nr:ABC transporter ATP-binding protein [Erythrobacter sp. CCH5-A1]